MTEIANNYGGALYELARDEGLAGEILPQLAALAESFAAEPGFVQLLSTPSIPKSERCRILDESFRDKANPYVLNFLKILTERGCMREFSGCYRVFLRRYNRDNGILPVTAVSAVALNGELQEKLRAKLGQLTGKSICLDCRVDPQVLGGIRLEYDGVEIDGTIRHRLDGLRSVLKNTVL